MSLDLICPTEPGRRALRGHWHATNFHGLPVRSSLTTPIAVAPNCTKRLPLNHAKSRMRWCKLREPIRPFHSEHSRQRLLGIAEDHVPGLAAGRQHLL